MNSLINTPLNWRTTLSFVAFATLLILLIGWLIINGTLPVKLAINYSDWASKFIQFWVVLAILIGILLPGIAFFVGASIQSYVESWVSIYWF